MGLQSIPRPGHHAEETHPADGPPLMEGPSACLFRSSLLAILDLGRPWNKYNSDHSGFLMENSLFPSSRMPEPNQPNMRNHFADMDRIRAGAESNLGLANVIHKKLCEEILDFQNSLAQDEEVAIQLASFGAAALIQIEDASDISYKDPYFIIFSGRSIESGARVRLVQHTTQLNFLLVSHKPRPDESRPARRIGFDI
jgi:hypothetical protein